MYEHIVKPLEKAGADGLHLASGDGLVRRAHPLLAIYACDYPEQITVTCARYGDCAECQIIEEMMGEGTALYPVRDLVKVLHGPDAFKEACKDAGAKAVFDAFWKDLPYSNIFRSIAPDILHQLYQGVIKHLKNWVITAYGAAEIDARCRRLPPNHHVRLFVNRISSLSRLTGQEHNDIARFLLSIIVDIPLPGGFSTNKDIFVDLGVRPHFRLPKLHFLNHYIWKIKYFGSLDNSNTEYTERLHIDMTKDAYRASNRKDEYMQMTKWLDRKEKILKHQNFIAWRVAGCPPIQRFDHWLPLVRIPRTLELPKRATILSITISRAQKTYSAPYLLPSLARLTRQLRSPQELSRSRQAEDGVLEEVKALATSISAYSIIRFIHHDPITGSKHTIDSIHSQPGRKDRRGRPVPGRFDAALVRVVTDERTSPLKAYRIGQVRLIFSLSHDIMSQLFASIPYANWPKHFTYIEWLSPFKSAPDEVHLLHKISRVRFIDGGGLASVVDVADIIRSVPLAPRFGKVADRSWTSSNVMEKCNEFYVNPYPSTTDSCIYYEIILASFMNVTSSIM
ncbi:hypothetical protein AAF712_012679 [Marasmius tenuissimus]|uniref:Uncharacterized protein n=1 Tax=Marasmius tenuissimus TaxID=585030 RepID=A0ABR2ZG16_9AGAR